MESEVKFNPIKSIAVSSEQDRELARTVDDLHQIQAQKKHRRETVFLIIKHKAVYLHASLGILKVVKSLCEQCSRVIVE